MVFQCHFQKNFRYIVAQVVVNPITMQSQPRLPSIYIKNIKCTYKLKQGLKINKVYNK
jgi:hypothetical protein